MRGDKSGVGGEWRRNWTVVVAGAMGYSSAALHNYGFGPFVIPLEQEFGWSRADVMIGLTIASSFGLFFNFAVGVLVDRLGPRRVGVLGLTVKYGALALLSTATGSLLNWSLLWAFISIGVVLSQPIIWTSAVASRFDKGRGFAIAATLVGSSITQAISPLLGTFLIDEYGWRLAIVGISFAWLVVTFPFVFFFFRGKQELRTSVAPAASEAAPAESLPGVTVREGMRLRAFWVIAGANFTFVFYSASMAPNLVPLLGTKGAGPQEAALIASLVGIFSIISRLSAGHLLDRFPPHIVATVIFLLPVAGISLLLIEDPSFLLLATSVALFGATLGAEYDVVFFMTSRQLGMKSFGALLGAMMSAAAGAGIMAPYIAGWAYDRTGSYNNLLIAIMVLMATAAVAMAFIGKPRQDWNAQPS